MPDSFQDLFSAQSAEYARFRPLYPGELFEFLASLPQRTDRAWDCATGNGQAAIGLSPHFDEVVATDASDRQIALAQRRNNIRYRVATAESSGLSAASCDLVTVANAAHWFDLPAFYREVERVLRPGGIVAVWCYTRLSTAAELESALEDFYQELAPYWPDEVQNFVWDEYRSLPFPFEEISCPQFSITCSWSISDFLGYFSSWSAVQAYRSAAGTDPVKRLSDELTARRADVGRRYPATFRLHLRVGRNA